MIRSEKNGHVIARIGNIETIRSIARDSGRMTQNVELVACIKRVNNSVLAEAGYSRKEYQYSPSFTHTVLHSVLYEGQVVEQNVR
jgi:hypothetical protein